MKAPQVLIIEAGARIKSSSIRVLTTIIGEFGVVHEATQGGILRTGAESGGQ